MRGKLLLLIAITGFLVTACLISTPTQVPVATETPTHTIVLSPTWTASPTPTFSPPDFASLPPGQYVIYYDSADDALFASTADGVIQQKYSDYSGVSISQNGLIYQIENQIYNTLTGETQDITEQLALDCGMGRISPDRQYFIGRCEDGELYAISLLDNSKIQITQRTNKYDNFDGWLWSPDGKWISYINVDLDAPSDSAFPVRNLFLVDMTCLEGTTSCQEKTHGPIIGNVFMPNMGFYGWSPDSKYITIPSWGESGILVYDIQSDSLRSFPWDGGVYSVTWSPDGNWLAFSGWDADTEDLNVFLISPWGGEAIRLTSNKSHKVVYNWIEIPEP